MLVFRVVTALSLLVPSLSFADTIWLDNGDRITGTIELLDGGRLVMETEFAGQVTVNVERIRTLESDNSLLVKVRDTAERALSIKPSETPGRVLLLNGLPEPTELKITDIDQMMVPQPFIQDWVLQGNADASLDVKNADIDQRDLAVRFNTEARHGDWRHSLAGNFERYYSNDIKSRHEWESDYDLSWFFAEQWFWQTSFNHRRDHLGDVAKRTSIGMGPGYEWWNTSLTRFETSARLDHLRLENRDGSSSNFNALGLEYGYQRFVFGKRVEVFHNAETLVPDDPDVMFIVDTELGVRYMLNSWASLSLLTEWDYINSDEENVSVNDTRYRVGLGVSW
ncbi:hypothetical protein LCGC14_0031820 [marine sediment metagenome]